MTWLNCAPGSRIDSDAWDRQIEQDAANGKLDEFYQRLQKENQGGEDVPLDTFLNEK